MTMCRGTMLRLALLAAVLLLPLAQGAQSLDALQEPVASQGAAGAVADFTMTPAQAARVNYIVFRTPSNSLMAAELVDEHGETVWEIPEATNGVQPFARNATAGAYKLVLRGNGQVQVMHRILSENTSGTLDATRAYLLVPSQPWRVDITGNVSVEWAPLGGVNETLTLPANETAEKGRPHVVTLRGPAGAAYAMTLTPTEIAAGSPAQDETPAAAALALPALALAALALRRRRA